MVLGLIWKKKNPHHFFFFFLLWFEKKFVVLLLLYFYFFLCSFTRSKNLKLVQHNIDCCIIIRTNATRPVLGGSEFVVPKSYAK